MAQNAGKLFENDIKASATANQWIYRLRDNASSFSRGCNTRFTSDNICDFIMFDDRTSSLFLIECKSTKGTNIPLSMIRENQVKGLLNASRHCLSAGFIVNFRNESNDTFFIKIDNYIEMISNIGKKSFNIDDVKNNGGVRINCEKIRTRWKYNMDEFCNNIYLLGGGRDGS